MADFPVRELHFEALLLFPISPRLSSRTPVLMAAAFLLLAPAGLHAQQDRGSIAGSVTDASKGVLQGAQVEIEPAKQRAVTDAQGSFIIPGVPAGHYKVEVNYLGFAEYTTEVDVTAGAIANVSAVLTVSGSSSQVVVRAEREVGEAEALNRQRVADNIVQVLPSEVINSLPNVNIADAIGRMPSVSLERDEGEGKYVQIRGTEPRLNSVTIDGIVVPSPENVRNVKLDTIPADLVESIEVNKTKTANMDGEGIGGTVNLVTRQATDTPYIAVEGLLGHTPIGGNGGRGEDQVFATFGQRFGADKRLGFLATGSYDWNGRGINDIEPATAVNPIVDANGNPTGATVNAPSEIDLRDYYYDRSRYGTGGTLDYRLSENSSAFVKGLYSYFNDYGENSIYSLTAGNFTSPTTTDGTGSTSYQDNYRRPTQELWSVLAGAHQEHGNAIWSYNVALSQAALTGGSTYSTFNGISNVPFSITQNDPFVPRFTAGNGVNIFDASQYTLNDISVQDDHTHERDVVGEVNYGQRYTARDSWFGNWQVGFKVRDVVKSQIYHNTDATGPTPALNTLLSGHSDPHYYFDLLAYGPQAQATKILAFEQANAGAFTVAESASRDLPADWNVNERVYAGFAMNTLNFGRYKLNTGVRIEGTTEDARGNLLNAADNSITPSTNTQSYVYALPSVTGQYTFSDYTDVRLAYSIALSRPNYGDLAPYFVYTPGTANTAGDPALSAGNPKLKPTWAHNVDLLGEHYFKTIGVIQGGVFYKMLYNYIATSTTTIPFTPPNGPQGTYYETAPLNVSAAHLIGVEGSWEQHLTMLPGALEGTGFRANYSFTSSVAGIPGRSDHPTLQRNAPNNYNFDVTYDKYGISARMGITHNDAYLWSYAYQDGTPIAGLATTPTPGGVKGPGSDTYIYPHTQVDAQASYLIPHGRGASFVAQFLNLNNEVFGFYNGSEQYPIQREYYKPTFTFGLRWTNNSERGQVFRQ